MRYDECPGLCITNYKKHTGIAIDAEAEMVSIIGVFSGGKDNEINIQKDDSDAESTEH